MLVCAPACGWTFACSAPKSDFARSIASLLDLVDDLAAPVVAPARVPLRVLVRGHRPDGLEHRRPGEVLGGDQLDLAALPLELAAEQLGDLRIDVGEPGGTELLERLLRDGHRPDRNRAADGCRRRPDARERVGGGHGALAEHARLRAGEVEHRRRCAGQLAAVELRAAAARSSSGHLVRASAGPAPPGRFALVAATAPTRSSTPRAAAGELGHADADRLRASRPSASGTAAPGSAATSVYGPGSSARAITAARPRSSGTALEQRVEVGGEQRDRLRSSPALQRVEPATGSSR